MKPFPEEAILRLCPVQQICLRLDFFKLLLQPRSGSICIRLLRENFVIARVESLVMCILHDQEHEVQGEQQSKQAPEPR